MKINAALPILTAVLCMATACRRNPSSFQPPSQPASPARMLSHQDYGCAEGSRSMKRLESAASITGFVLKQDTLTLTIGLTYPCCASFEDNFRLEGARLGVTSLDVAEDHCRCICRYFKDVVLYFPDSTGLFVSYRLLRPPSAEAIVSLDTLLRIR
jgi:hypothetical protein